MVSKACCYPLSLFSHVLLFDRQVAALTTFYNLQAVLHLKKYVAQPECVTTPHWWEGIETETIHPKQNPYSWVKL